MNDGDATIAESKPMAPDRKRRRRALLRSWVCPGAGFALLGSRGWALLTYFVCIGLLPAIAWLGLRPEPASAWMAAGVLLTAVALSVAEQFACKWAVLQAPAPRILAYHFPLSCTVFWISFIGAGVIFFTNFGSVRMAGEGMSTTIEKGELILYSKRLDPGRLLAGNIVIYRLSDRSAWGQPGWLTVSRILAVPGDTLSIRDGHYLVNGIAGPPASGTLPYAPVVAVPTEPQKITVPADHFFVVQDDSMRSYDSRVLAWVEYRNIAANRLYYLGRAFLKSVE